MVLPEVDDVPECLLPGLPVVREPRLHHQIVVVAVVHAAALHSVVGAGVVDQASDLGGAAQPIQQLCLVPCDDRTAATSRVHAVAAVGHLILVS